MREHAQTDCRREPHADRERLLQHRVPRVERRHEEHAQERRDGEVVPERRRQLHLLIVYEIRHDEDPKAKGAKPQRALPIKGRCCANSGTTLSPVWRPTGDTNRRPSPENSSGACSPLPLGRVPPNRGVRDISDSYYSHLSLDYRSQPCYDIRILAHRGASPETILKAERGVASCGRRLVTARLGRLGTPPSRHYDLGARSSLHGSEGTCPPL